MMRKKLFLGILASIFAALVTAEAAPEEGERFGIRAGASVDPDQFHFGGHLESAPLVKRLTFRPNLELGVGDNRTTVAFNIEFAYYLPIRRSSWSPYIGAGPALNIFNFRGDAGGSRRDGTEVDGGFNILVGVQHRDGLFGELKVGAIGSPDLKFTVGFSFR